MGKTAKGGGATELMRELTESLQATSEGVVPWFLENMPPGYFQDTPRSQQLSHLRAIIGAKASGRPMEFTLRNDEQDHWTCVRPANRPGVVAELSRSLPPDRHLRAASIYAAKDGNLVIVNFEFGEGPRFDASDAAQAEKLQAIIDYAKEHAPEWSEGEIRDYATGLPAEYLMAVTPLRATAHWRLFRDVAGRAGTRVVLEREDEPDQSRITVAVTNVMTGHMLERVTRRLKASHIDIHRAYLDQIRDCQGGSVTIFGFVVSGPDGAHLVEQSDLWKELRHDLLRLKWTDNRALELSYRNPGLTMLRAEVLIGLCDLVHQVLTKENAYAFNQERIARLTEINLTQARKIVNLFLARFDPDSRLSQKVFEARREDLLAEIDSSVGIEDAQQILKTMLNAVGAVLRTNVHLERRCSLSMRLDPAFLKAEGREDLPYGVFFVHGREMNGFHVRFRDISRGGVRVIRPRHEDLHAHEAERLYDEAYGLASAQQLKNKDIPEGGSKAAILVPPAANIDRCIKAFIDGLLDLITPDPETRKRVIDYFGERELLYLGPDENITPAHIEWIIRRAHERGYPNANAFMSSKPGAGINHKVYGVTSEGVAVFLDVALHSIGIDPTKQPFTIKMTGGPDGDVGGNMIRILHRDYGDNARIVGIADGSGVGEDPDGLDMAELLRLFDAGLPIGEFDRTKLSPRGRIVTVDEPEGTQLRNTLHNRVVADAFVPAGGRPNTIHERNWKDFLLPDGAPSAKVIIEGANLFLNPEARQQLSAKGVVIFKDSSANKCGVICSSYEIVASMLLDEPDFLKIKETFVQQVLEKLRQLARREAELLLRIQKHQKGTPLPQMSIRLSQMMIVAADAIVQQIDRLKPEDGELFRQLVIDHLPPILLETVGDRLWRDVPKPYLGWIMAKSLAARIVYREGYRYLEAMPREGIGEMAVNYLHSELERFRLADEVMSSELPDRERIARLLHKAGIMATLGDDT